jgi:hypothetical protein
MEWMRVEVVETVITYQVTRTNEGLSQSGKDNATIAMSGCTTVGHGIPKVLNTGNTVIQASVNSIKENEQLPFVYNLYDPGHIQRLGRNASDRDDDGRAQVSICRRREGILWGRVSVHGLKER